MLSKKKIVVGARASLLSVSQASEVIKLLKIKFPQHSFSLKKILTSGDNKSRALSKVRGKYWQGNDTGIFVKEIEEALLTGKIDLAVHSLKDLPCALPDGLELAAVTQRLDPRDCIIFRDKHKAAQLKKGVIIGTSSLRRQAQLLHWRPDLKLKELRGNLDTRIEKLINGEFDAIVVALAGLKRLGLGYRNLSVEAIAPWIILPAPGQGALGIEARSEDKIIKAIAKKINHRTTFLCTACERAFLKELGGGCRLPLGALAEIKAGQVHLQVVVANQNGKRIIRLSRSAPLKEAESLGRQLARAVSNRGGWEILKEAKGLEK